MWNLSFLEYKQKNSSNYLRVRQHLVFICNDDCSTRIKSSHESHGVWLVLHRVPHRNQIQQENWEVVSVAFLLLVPQSHAEGSKEWFHVQFCCGLAEFLQALSASSLVAVLWEAVRREPVVLLAQGWEAEARPYFKLESAEDTPWAAPSQGRMSHTLTSSTSAELLGWRLSCSSLTVRG